MKRLKAKLNQELVKKIVDATMEKIDWDMVKNYAETDFSIAYDFEMDQSVMDADETLTEEDAIEMTKEYIRRTEDVEQTEKYVWSVIRTVARNIGEEQTVDAIMMESYPDNKNELIDAVFAAKGEQDIVEYVCKQVTPDESRLKDVNNEILKYIQKTEQ